MKVKNYILVILVMAVLLITAGCQTTRGIFADVKGMSAAAEEALTPIAEKAEASDKARMQRLEQRERDNAKATLDEYNQNIANIQATGNRQ